MIHNSQRSPLTLRFGLIILLCLVAPVGIFMTYLNLSIGDTFRQSVAETMVTRKQSLETWIETDNLNLRKLSDFILVDPRLQASLASEARGKPLDRDWWLSLARISATSFLLWRDGVPPLLLGVADDEARDLTAAAEDWWRFAAGSRISVINGKVFRFFSLLIPATSPSGASQEAALILARRLDFSSLTWLRDKTGAGVTIIDEVSREAVFSTFPGLLAHQMVATWLSRSRPLPVDGMQAATWQGQGYNSLSFILKIDPSSRLRAVIATPDRFNAQLDITKPILMVAILIILMIIFFGFLMTKLIIGPILSLSYAVDSLRLHLRQNGPLVSIPIRSNDEIGDLARAINELGQELGLSSEKIAEQRSEIIAYTHSLEERVQERTRELEDARMRAEIANQHKSKFLVNMNHELRTPLNSISGITDLLRYGAYEKDEEVAALLVKISELLEQNREVSLSLRISLAIAAQSLTVGSGGKRAIVEVLQQQLSTLPGGPGPEITALIMEALRLVGEEDRQILRAYNNIHDAGNSLLGIIDEVINLSRIESGVINIEPTRIRIAELISSCMVHAEAYALYRGKLHHFELTKTIDPELPEWICLDSQKIKQVVLNLLTNAIKYTDSGRVQLRVGLQVEESRTMVLCSVQDTGRGISDKDRPVMFMEFGRSFEVREIEGTGLGLALSKRLVERHGGAMGFTSQPGRGSTFWFTLPLVLEVEKPGQA